MSVSVKSASVYDSTRRGEPLSGSGLTTPGAAPRRKGVARRRRGLGTSVSRSEKFGPRAQKRRSRRDLQRLAAELSGADFLKDCGRKSILKSGGVHVRGGSGEVAGYAGIAHCGSVHACPDCAAKIGAHRATELGEVISWARKQGHTVALLTLTTRHRKGQSLESVWDRVQKGWGTVTTGWGSESESSYAKRVEKNRLSWADWFAGEKKRKPKDPSKIAPRRVGIAEAAGVLGWARAVEVTEGSNGWHVHLHVLLVLEGREGDQVERVARLESKVFGLWEKGITKAGGTVEREPGADIRVMYGSAEKVLAAYLTKAGDALASARKGHEARAFAEKEARALAMETTLGAFKKGRKSGSRTPFEMLANMLQTGDLEDQHLWQEWVRSSRGRRALTWSAGLREMAGLAEEEKTDEEIASEDIGTANLLFLPRATWLAIRDDSRRFEVLEVMERGGIEDTTRLLNSWSMPWVIVPPGDEDRDE